MNQRQKTGLIKPQAVIFDLDGTLLDTLEDLAEAMNSVLERYGFPTHRPEAYKYFVGDGMEVLVRRALPEEVRDGETFFRCLSDMQAEYASRWNRKTRPYPGVPELLDVLARQGRPMAVLTNKPHEAGLMVVAELLAGWKFQLVLGARPAVPKKPNPAGALEIASRLKIPPEGFLYLGDTAVDMQTAVRAGMIPVGVLWGFRTREELVGAGARILLEKPLDLLEWL